MVATPALKLNVMFANFPYGGNGATSSEHPNIREWTVETALKMSKDPRIGGFWSKDFSDCPIPMTRNKAIRTAIEEGCHLLLMIDSDQSPNLHKGEPWFKPFWDEAFGFIYDNYHKGPRLVFAPYCGPPNGGESVYVFQWRNYGDHGDETEYSLEMYSREQAAIMSGIQEAAAGPTGLILIDLRLMDLIQPSGRPKRDILEDLRSGKISVEQAEYQLREGYFYYEWKNQYAAEKASTEDVTFTRDIALAGQEKLGYNPVFCAWDSWIGHHKPWCVGRPRRYLTQQVGASLRKAVLEDNHPRETFMEINPNGTGDATLDRAIKDALARHEAVPASRNPNGVPLIEMVYEDGQKLRDFGSGAWYDHGHTPAEQVRVLTDIIRSKIHLNPGRGVRVLEVGSWVGRTAVAMAEVGEDVQVHCVDTWEGTKGDMTGDALIEEAGGPEGVYAKFLENVGDRLNKSIFPWKGRSVDRGEQHWGKFDLIYIDADHSYEGCKGDILAWWKHLEDDGVMVGHDYLVKGFMGVVDAVKEVFGENYSTQGWHPGGAMWVARKSDHPDLEKEIKRGRFACAAV
jgi:hypothetical protein